MHRNSSAADMAFELWAGQCRAVRMANTSTGCSRDVLDNPGESCDSSRWTASCGHRRASQITGKRTTTASRPKETPHQNRSQLYIPCHRCAALLLALSQWTSRALHPGMAALSRMAPTLPPFTTTATPTAAVPGHKP